MNKHLFPTMMTLSFMFFAASINSAWAQVGWTVEKCIQYAVENNHDVRIAKLKLDNYNVNLKQSKGSFLPTLEAGIGVQYNFGRAIDPETNTYTDVSTFYNGYSLSASIPVFDGFGRLHALKAAKADELMGKSAVQQERDLTALATYQAFVDVLYYQGTVQIAEAKVLEQAELLRKTRTMEEVGQKSLADVAQIEAQKAEADYDLTHQGNLLESALLTLKKTMNYPLNEKLCIISIPLGNETGLDDGKPSSAFANCFGQVESLLPILQQAYHARESALHQWRQARADFFPTLSLGAGLSTTYYKTLNEANTNSFSHQFRNNMGEYVTATLSIPIFNRMRTISNVRRAKNNYLLAQETYAQQCDELQKLTVEAALDVHNYQSEVRQMERKVEADSLAYALVKRKFEEGLLSATDLKTSAAALLQSQVTLLQKQLMTCLKRRLLDYYTGKASFHDFNEKTNF